MNYGEKLMKIEFVENLEELSIKSDGPN